MKRFISIMAMSAIVAGIVSCGKEEIDSQAEKDAQFKEIAENFLTKTVYPTYAALADATEELVENLNSFKASPSQDKLDKACKTFLAARSQWELSEAFLFGAATDFGIDPHIDSWPLDEDGFNDLMASPKILANMDGEDGAEYAGNKLGNELLGFHGIEYILFENGAPKQVSKITGNEAIYVVAVSGDLRNRTAQLDVAWRGDAAPKARVELVEDLELNTTVGGGDLNYGENLLAAGQAGSTFRSWTHAMQAILQACSDIADEVGTSKIGKAHTGEDKSYIESPYSENSIADFYDNITSVKNVYTHFHKYLEENDKDVDAALSAAIENALAKVKAMKAPFVTNFTDNSASTAMQACAELDEQIGKAITSIAQ